MLERDGCSRFSGEFKVHKLEEFYETSLAQEKRATQFTIFYLPVPYTKNLRCVFVKVHNNIFLFIFYFFKLKCLRFHSSKNPKWKNTRKSSPQIVLTGLVLTVINFRHKSSATITIYSMFVSLNV